MVKLDLSWRGAEMAVKEVREALNSLPSECDNLPVEMTVADANTGCDTCGYGATMHSEIISRVFYLEGIGCVELECDW